MRMSRPITLLHLLLGLRTSTSSALSTRSKSPASTLFAQCHATNLYSPFSTQYTSTYKPPPLAKTYSTMSNQPNPDPQTGSDPEKPNPILSLPDSSTASNDTQQLDVNGDGVKLDHIGPLVVNADGTLARIANWAEMTEVEKRNTLRILGKRNKARMEKLKAEGKGEQGAEAGGEETPQ